MSSKKGISDVVSTVLIILLVVAAVAIVGAIIIRTTSNTAPQISSAVNCQTFDVTPVSCSYDTDDAYLIFRTKAGTGTLSGLKLIVDTSTGSSITQDIATTGLGAVETNSYSLGISTGQVPAQFSLSATLTDSSGKAQICPQTRKVSCSYAQQQTSDLVTMNDDGKTTPGPRTGGSGGSSYQLSVTISSPSGFASRVSSNPAGISPQCSIPVTTQTGVVYTRTCSSNFNQGAVVLTAAPNTAGQSISCAWTSCDSVSSTNGCVCTMNMNSQKSVSVVTTSPPS